MTYLGQYVVCVRIKQKIYIYMLYMITEKIESRTLTKSISYECKCKLDGRKYSSDDKFNNDKC